MYTISRFSIKKNDSEETRRKVLLEVLRENIDVKTEFFQQTVVDCIVNIGGGYSI